MKGAKEVFRLYSVKHDSIKEFFTDFESADKIALKYNVNVLLIKFLKRSDNSVYTISSIVDNMERE